MLASFLVTSRETLEASLLVGIVLSYLDRTNNQQYKKSVYYAIVVGILASILSALLFTVVAGGFEGRTEELFEGITMLIGAFLLTTMILWMKKQKHLATIEGKVAKHIENPTYGKFGIFLLVFLAIIREGIETVIFLNALHYSSGMSLVSGALGVIVAKKSNTRRHDKGNRDY